MNKHNVEMNDTGRELSERELEQIQGGNIIADAWRQVQEEGLVPMPRGQVQLVRGDQRRARASSGSERASALASTLR